MDIDNKESEWHKSFLEGSWETHLTGISEGVPRAFKDSVHLFAISLKKEIDRHSALNSDEIISYINQISSNIYKLFEPEPNIKLPEPSEIVIESPKVLGLPEVLEEQKLDAPLISEEKEEVVTKLFSKVLKIFDADNRSLNEVYQALDANKDGKVSMNELRAEFLKHDPSLTFEECKAVFDILDGNGDGFITNHELVKRFKLVKEKAEEEEKDPLSCIVISKPLDPEKIHGNLSVMLLKATGLKPGTHTVMISIKNYLEYLTPDTIETNPIWNFRADFLLENVTLETMPYLIDVELLNKGKSEGSGTFSFIKALDVPNEFSLKSKLEIKTSTGQPRGFLYFQVQWTPIIPKGFSEPYNQTVKETTDNTEESKTTTKTIPDSIGYYYVIKKSQKIIEKFINVEKNPNEGLKKNLYGSRKEGTSGSRKSLPIKEDVVENRKSNELAALRPQKSQKAKNLNN
jgi:EF hand